MSDQSLTFTFKLKNHDEAYAECGSNLTTSSEANEFWQNIPVPDDLLEIQDETEEQ